jgi:hypothetical protein
MPLPRPASPRALLQDIRNFTRERSPIQWIAALVAVAMPVIIIIGFITDAKTNIAPGEQLIYVDSWGENRTDAEIKAAQQKHEAERQAAAAARQAEFKKLEKRFGMDEK